MDRAVLAAYGWEDIPTECEFVLDYEIDEEEWGNKTQAVPIPLARRCARRGASALDSAERRARSGSSAGQRPLRRRSGDGERAASPLVATLQAEALF